MGMRQALASLESRGGLNTQALFGNSLCGRSSGHVLGAPLKGFKAHGQYYV